MLTRSQRQELLIFGVAGFLFLACLLALAYSGGAFGGSGYAPLWPDRHRDVIGNWSDAFNFLDLIPGPPFLLLFLLFSLLTGLLALVVRNVLLHWTEPGAAFTSFRRVPFHLKPTFLEIAYLRGGEKAVLETAVCNLYRLGILSQYLSTRTSMILEPPGERQSLSSLERVVCDALASRACAPYALARDSRVRGEIENVIAAARPKLAALGFGPTRETWVTAIAVAGLALMVVDGLGAIRLIRSELRGYHNVEGLLLLMGLSTALTLWMLLRMRSSRAGIHYLKQLREDSRAVIRQCQSLMGEVRSPEVIYAIAVCGAGAMAATPYEQIPSQLTPPPSSSTGDSGCGGGSCGGGGCGGGGCGGGGCGGG